MDQRISLAMDIALMALLSLLSSGLQAPTHSQTTSNSIDMQKNDSNYVWMPPTVTSCPGYERGNPSRRNMTGCETGTILDPVDHEMAFGFSSGENPDWNACGLPHLPEEK